MINFKKSLRKASKGFTLISKACKRSSKIYSNGFTLIELLIVIAILGVLAVVVLVAVNPPEQLARARDAGRQSTVPQLGRALQAYSTARGGQYPAESNTWIQSLVTAGEISTVPSAVNYSISGITACSGSGFGVQNTYCYDTDGNTPPLNGIIVARLESTAQNSKCTTPAVAWEVYDTVRGRGGLVCSQNAPTYNAAGQTFVD